MPTLNIEGKSVQVDDSFLKLSPDQQNATVDEIAKSLLHGSPPASQAEKAAAPSITDAVTDIPSEVAGAFKQGGQHFTGNNVVDAPGYDTRTRGELGPIEGLLRTGKQVLGLPEMIASPIVGAARSIGGHLMEQGEHAVGSVIAPEIAAKEDRQQHYENAKGDVDTAMSAVASRGAPVTAVATVPKAIAPSIQELKAAASAGYDGPELASLEVKPQSISDFSQRAKASLNKDGFDENVAPKTFGILDKLENIPTTQGGSTVVTGNNIQSLRKILGSAAGSADATERKAASLALEALDSHVTNLPAADVVAGDAKTAGEALDTANANYSAAKHAETIDNKTIQAELRAAASNSGQNVANTVRQRMADILINPKQQRGFTADELEQMDTIVRGTKGQNALRYAGNVLGGGGGLGAHITAGSGAALGSMFGPVGAAVGAAAAPAAGYLLKALSNRMTLKQAADLSTAIRSRAPLASSSQKFQQAASTFSSSPSPKAMAAVVLTARNLSNNLRGAGFNIAPSDLLSGVQSPGSGSAQDQQNVPGPPAQ